MTLRMVFDRWMLVSNGILGGDETVVVSSWRAALQPSFWRRARRFLGVTDCVLLSWLDVFFFFLRCSLFIDSHAVWNLFLDQGRVL